jgi:hypothetical protein
MPLRDCSDDIRDRFETKLEASGEQAASPARNLTRARARARSQALQARMSDGLGQKLHQLDLRMTRQAGLATAGNDGHRTTIVAQPAVLKHDRKPRMLMFPGPASQDGVLRCAALISPCRGALRRGVVRLCCTALQHGVLRCNVVRCVATWCGALQRQEQLLESIALSMGVLGDEQRKGAAAVRYTHTRARARAHAHARTRTHSLAGAARS